MARNLQAKLPSSDTIRIFDINKGAADKLAREMRTQQAGGAAVEVASSVDEVSMNAVSVYAVLPCLIFYMMSHLFYL